MVLVPWLVKINVSVIKLYYKKETQCKAQMYKNKKCQNWDRLKQFISGGPGCVKVVNADINNSIIFWEKGNQ